MSNALEQLRKKLEEQNKKSEGGYSGDNASYPFWNIAEGSKATVRFLPDGDESNTFFWREKLSIRLPFAGVSGEHENSIQITVPCVEMFGETCPIIARTKSWWKDPVRVDTARTYWKKKSYIFQGFVVNSPLTEENVPENPIRRFVMSSSIYNIVKDSLMNPEMEDLPTDYISGRDFNIAKTKKGEFANYTTSSWSFKTRSLNDDEMTALDQHGLFNLGNFLGRKPDQDEMDMIVAMFEDSLAGRPFDTASYGDKYRPNGFVRPSEAIANQQKVEAKQQETTSTSDEDEAETVSKPASKTASGKTDPQDIIDRMRERMLNKAS